MVHSQAKIRPMMRCVRTSSDDEAGATVVSVIGDEDDGE